MISRNGESGRQRLATLILTSDPLEGSGWVHANPRCSISRAIKAGVIGHCIDRITEVEGGEGASIRDDVGR